MNNYEVKGKTKDIQYQILKFFKSGFESIQPKLNWQRFNKMISYHFSLNFFILLHALNEYKQKSFFFGQHFRNSLGGEDFIPPTRRTLFL